MSLHHHLSRRPLGLPFLPSDDERAQRDVRRELLALAEAHAAAGVGVMRLEPVADIASLAFARVNKEPPDPISPHLDDGAFVSYPLP